MIWWIKNAKDSTEYIFPSSPLCLPLYAILRPIMTKKNKQRSFRHLESTYLMQLTPEAIGQTPVRRRADLGSILPVRSTNFNVFLPRKAWVGNNWMTLTHCINIVLMGKKMSRATSINKDERQICRVWMFRWRAGRNLTHIQSLNTKTATTSDGLQFI